jgi:hypothetical protein
MGLTRCPETSVLNQPTLRNNPENGMVLGDLRTFCELQRLFTMNKMKGWLLTADLLEMVLAVNCLFECPVHIFVWKK